MSKRTRAVMAMLASLILVAAAAAIGQRRLQDNGGVSSGASGSYSVTAFFPRAIGLFPRSTVRVLGVEVGRVDRVTPSGDRVQVDMHVQNGVRVPVDVSASIVPISLISDRYIQLDPVWSGGPALSDGGVIPLERGIAPAELDDLLGTLNKLISALEPGTPTEPGALGQLIVNASKALDGKSQALSNTAQNVSALLADLGARSSNLDSLFVSLDKVTSSIAARDAQIIGTNLGLSVALGALASERTDLEAGLANLAHLVSEAGKLVSDHRSDLEADLKILADVGALIQKNQYGLLENTLWLPVLARGGYQGNDHVLQREYVRDNQAQHF